MLGQDVYGDTLLNARPAFAIPGLPSVDTRWGNFYTGPPVPGETIIPRNYGIGPAQFSVNLRVSRTWGFGPETGGPRGSGERLSQLTGRIGAPAAADHRVAAVPGAAAGAGR